MDGINRHILTLAPALNLIAGLEVGVCIVHPAGELHAALVDAGVKVWSLGFTNGHKPGIYFAFKKVLDRFKPDIVHVHVVAIMERMLLARKYRNLKYVVTIHGIGDSLLEKKPSIDPQPSKVKQRQSLKRRIEDWINRRYAIRYNACCYISNGVREKLLPPEKVTKFSPVCYNPMSFVEPQERSFRLHDLIGVGHNVPVIGTACRIYQVKQPQCFTEVMCQVLASSPTAHAVVMGDGDSSLIASCKDIVNSYDVNDRFHFLGYRSDAPELVNDLSCFVLTSKSEGMPTSVLESFVAKVPVAMLRGEGGLRDIDLLNSPEKPIATIADKDDMHGLANGIIELINSPEKALAQAENAFEVGKKSFDVSSVASQLHDLYNDLIQL